MPLWSEIIEEKMKRKLQSSFVFQEEKASIQTDLQYLESMKTDRVACYSSLEKKNLFRLKKRKHQTNKKRL